MEWIKVEDELPKVMTNYSSSSGYVLGYADGHFYGDVFYNHFLKVWHKTNIHTQIQITHWHPRIEPTN